MVNDRRFRAAFKGISRSDWAKISERLAVTNSAGIQSKDGYLVGAGCMAHACSSDQAAFVISEETGKGDFVLIETPGSSTSAIVRTYQWPGLPINKTPLANWAQQSGANIDNQVTAPPAPSQQTSFDCTKARSDAERIICMRPLLFVAACLIASPSFATEAWKCTYNGETFYVSMPCEDAIKWGITPPFKERPDPPECATLKRQKDALRAELEDAVSPPGKVPDEEVARLDRSVADLETEQHLHGCKDAAPVP